MKKKTCSLGCDKKMNEKYKEKLTSSIRERRVFSHGTMSVEGEEVVPAYMLSVF